ncbi:hypothetical protein [Leptospira borgpetersenii]|uniref:hypothetical protein n=1 Tax=Leptospira borgpetersenii TaxID=174 RepID=UPI000B243F5E|nr:hypothetical protein [Leptospira borgpetersenii]MBE8363086.1 hypothetical protein [Leptospira borgpetersenii serovar Balcanica]MBE8402477.1 hypothetical protein [Leptospira borgpetersenii serovar Tarassovi]MBE8368230.1 hypothetical protein [Leptospira borgpetersenii serovar Balcanica]MBE8411145.1 hypothetical protein [Leptospira borgpetersenii serovar Tarassovi]MBE8414469.1 hypothetical protein [Leptospira borgpetersenii serovar Tarassovi]
MNFQFDLTNGVWELKNVSGSFRITKDLSREITSKVDIPFLDIKRIACKSGRIEGHHIFLSNNSSDVSAYQNLSQNLECRNSYESVPTIKIR